MSLDKALGALQWALVFLMIACCAQLVIAIMKLIQLYKGE